MVVHRFSRINLARYVAEHGSQGRQNIDETSATVSRPLSTVRISNASIAKNVTISHFRHLKVDLPPYGDCCEGVVLNRSGYLTTSRCNRSSQTDESRAVRISQGLMSAQFALTQLALLSECSKTSGCIMANKITSAATVVGG